MRRGLAAVLLTALAAGAAAQTPSVTLAELDRLGREIAAAGCPRPQEVKSSFLPNPRRPDAPDEMRSTDCRDFRVAHYLSNEGGATRVQPMELVIERPHARLDARLAPGVAEASVRALLGAPATVRRTAIGYAIGPRDTLVFELFDSRVRAVTWSWDVD